ncbi:MAG: hypothetical protein IKP28_00305 [Clostridia bacterium]|nr:hypothetical protein [Clostridia bacterium]
MENASKALIIAGAVLIAILLIAFGMVMINAAQSPVDIAVQGANSQAAQVFNSQFSSYAGNKVSGANVRTLMTAINSNNANSSNKVKVTFSYKNASGANTTGLTSATNGIANQINNASSSKTFTVSFGYGTSGYIETCTIKEN